MNDHRSGDSRVVNMYASDTVLKDERAPSWKDVLRLWEKLDNGLKAIHQSGGLLRG
ncbi:MAG TPA: hypothetical protein VIY49_30555 [Bryobacteraceae bacterium]